MMLLVNRKNAFSTSAFADEADADLGLQLEALKENRIGGLDVRSVGGVNVIDLKPEVLASVRERAAAAGIAIHAVGSPVNKVPLRPENRQAEFAKLKKAIAAAQALGTQRVRIFTPEAPAKDLRDAWPAVQAWMSDMVDLAEAEDIVLLHENDARFFGAYPEGAKRLCGEFAGPAFRFCFDFANTVLLGFRPMPDWFPWLLPYLDTLHIKDAVQAQGRVVPAGEGNGQMVETLRWLIEQKWSGTLTLEPHLQAAGPFGGFSGPELFKVAADALRAVVTQAGGSC